MAAAARIGYPLMLKATAGGGGRGIRMVASDADLTDAYERTRDEAPRAFGSGVVFLERLVTGARHVEVQVIADGQGTAWALGVRDCSIQRRNQKVIEESASPVLDRRAGRPSSRQSAERLALAVGLRRRRHRRVPLPPGRAVLRLPRGQHPAAGRAPDHRGHHRHRPGQGPDPRRGRRPARGRAAGRAAATPSRPGSTPRTPTATSRPSPGRIALLELPAGPGIRVDTGVGEGDTIPADFDSMIAKIIAVRPRPATRRWPGCAARWPRRRSSSRAARRTRASSSTCSTSPRSSTARADTGWIDRVRAEGRLVSHRARRRRARRRRRSRPTRTRRQVERAAAARDRPRRPAAGPAPRSAAPSTSSCAARRTRSRSRSIGPHRFRVGVGARRRRADRRRRARAARRRTPAGWSSAASGYRLRHRHPRPGPRSSRSTASPTASAATRAACCARPRRRSSSRPRSQVGAEVEAGAPVLVLESDEDGDGAARRRSPRGSRELLVAAGSQVETGAPLVRLEPRADDEAAAAEAAPTDAVDLDLPDRSGRARRRPGASRGLDDLRGLLLGFDVDPRDEGADAVRLPRGARPSSPRQGDAPLAAEIDAARACSPTSPS